MTKLDFLPKLLHKATCSALFIGNFHSQKIKKKNLEHKVLLFFEISIHKHNICSSVSGGIREPKISLQ